MPLNETYPLAVTFIVGPRRRTDGTVYEGPIGTGFVIRHESSNVNGLGFEYVVTAAHVVDGQSATAARFRRQEGGVYDLPIHEWIPHPKADVALAPLRGHDGLGLHLLHIPEAVFICSDGWDEFEPELGDPVYFLGLFDLHKRMGDENVPLVRSGTLAALDEKDVPMEWPDKTTRYFDAHLIDCRSYGGFSGSPCFLQKPPTKMPVPLVASDLPGYIGGLTSRPTPLLGIVSGHFDMWKEAKLTGDLPLEPGTVESEVNTGVGVITPARKIVEVLAMPELSDDRERIEKEHENEAPTAATPDMTSKGESEFERFEQLTRELVNTPKKNTESETE